MKVKEGDTVEVGTLLGIVNEGKSGSIKTAETRSIEQDQQSYIPPKAAKKKNIIKDTVKKRKKTISTQQETLTLVDESKDENSNEALILDTLAEEDSGEIKDEKYIPPKTTKH